MKNKPKKHRLNKTKRKLHVLTVRLNASTVKKAKQHKLKMSRIMREALEAVVACYG